MRRKTKAIIAGIVIAFLCLGVGVYIYLCSYRVSLKEVTVTNFPSIFIDDNTVKKINDGKLLEESNYFNDVWNISNTSNGKYGRLVQVTFNFDVSRYSKHNDYIIEKSVDFSDLSEDEKIFFAKSTGISGDLLFACEGDELSAPTYVDLWGVTYDKTEDEIKEIIKKIKITFIVQHSNGKIDTKKINLSKMKVDALEADEAEIEIAKEFLNIDK